MNRESVKSKISLSVWYTGAASRLRAADTANWGAGPGLASSKLSW